MVDYGERMQEQPKRLVNQLSDVVRRLKSGDNTAVSAQGTPLSPFEPRTPLVETGPDRNQTLDTLALKRGLVLGAATSPPTITVSQNDYNPTGFLTTPVLRVTANAGLNITGFASDGTGHVIVLVNVGNALTLVHESASSAAANRMNLAGGANRAFAAGEVLLMFYDTGSSRWRLIS